jgi:hypothetical protein
VASPGTSPYQIFVGSQRPPFHHRRILLNMDQRFARLPVNGGYALMMLVLRHDLMPPDCL